MLWKGSNVRPIRLQLSICKQWSQRVGNWSRLGQNSRLEGEPLRGSNPNSRKSKSGVRRKKGRLLQSRSCVMWFKGGRGWSWTWRWRARRGGRLRCSRGCKRAEKCSSRQRAPPRPRPAPRFLFFHNILKKKLRSKPRSGIRWGLQYPNCWSYKSYKKK